MGAILLGALRLFLVPLLNPEAWPAIALVAAIAWGVGWWKGDAHGDRQCAHRIMIERAAQTNAITKAGEQSRAEIERLNNELDDKDREIAILDSQADADSNAHACGLSVDSVRRINRSRAGQPVRR